MTDLRGSIDRGALKTSKTRDGFNNPTLPGNDLFILKPYVHVTQFSDKRGFMYFHMMKLKYMYMYICMNFKYSMAQTL